MTADATHTLPAVSGTPGIWQETIPPCPHTRPAKCLSTITRDDSTTAYGGEAERAELPHPTAGLARGHRHVARRPHGRLRGLPGHGPRPGRCGQASAGPVRHRPQRAVMRWRRCRAGSAVVRGRAVRGCGRGGGEFAYARDEAKIGREILRAEAGLVAADVVGGQESGDVRAPVRGHGRGVSTPRVRRRVARAVGRISRSGPRVHGEYSLCSAATRALTGLRSRRRPRTGRCGAPCPRRPVRPWRRSCPRSARRGHAGAGGGSGSVHVTAMPPPGPPVGEPSTRTYPTTCPTTAGQCTTTPRRGLCAELLAHVQAAQPDTGLPRIPCRTV